MRYRRFLSIRDGEATMRAVWLLAFMAAIVLVIPNEAQAEKIVRQDGDWMCEVTSTDGLSKEVCRWQGSAYIYTVCMDFHPSSLIPTRRNCFRMPDGVATENDRPEWYPTTNAYPYYQRRFIDDGSICESYREPGAPLLREQCTPPDAYRTHRWTVCLAEDAGDRVFVDCFSSDGGVLSRERPKV
jgi:hypothetical protein